MFRSTISDQDRDLVMMVRDIVQESIAPRALKYDAQGGEGFDWSAIDLLAEHNLIAPSIPEEYGGRGLSHLITAMILEEIAAACAGVAMVVNTNLHSISPLLTAGTKEQKNCFLPMLTQKRAKLGAIANMDTKSNLDIVARSEQVDIRGSSLCGEQLGDKLVVKGFKDNVMNGSVGKFISTMVSVSPHGDRGSLQLVTLPMCSSGVEVGKSSKQLGLKYCNCTKVVFNDVEIQPEYFIGKPGSGFLLFMQSLDRSVPYTGAISLGIARAAYETALKVSKEKFILGRPSFEESAISHSLVNMACKLNAARQSVHFACWLIDNDMDSSAASPKSKIMSNTVAQEISRSTIGILGGGAYLKGNNAEKRIRDAKFLSLVDGSEQFFTYMIASQL